MEPNNTMFDTTDDNHDQLPVVFTTELTDGEKAALAQDVFVSPAEVAEMISEVSHTKVVQEHTSPHTPLQEQEQEQKQEGVPITNDASGATETEVEAIHTPEDEKVDSLTESVQYIQTPAVPETQPDEWLSRERGVDGVPAPAGVPLQPHIDTVLRLEDPAESAGNQFHLPKYPVFMATPLPDPADALTKSMKDDIYLNSPDMRAVSILDTDTVDRLADPLPLDRLPASTTLMIKYPLEWLELRPTKIQSCKLPSFGMCKVYYSHPLGNSTQNSYVLATSKETGNIVLKAIGAADGKEKGTEEDGEKDAPAEGYQGEDIETPPVSIAGKTDIETPPAGDGILDNPVCDAVQRELKTMNRREKTAAADAKQKDYPRLLFLHGFGFDTSINAPFINALAQTHEILTFDWPASGSSDRTPGDMYDVHTLVKYCLEVLALPTFNWISGFEIYNEVVQQATAPPDTETSGTNTANTDAAAATSVAEPLVMEKKFRVLEPTVLQRPITLVGHSVGGLIAAVVSQMLKPAVSSVKLLAPIGMTRELDRKALFLNEHPTLTWMSQPLMAVYPTLALKTILSCTDRIKNFPEPLHGNVKRKYESAVRSRCTNAIKRVLGTSTALPWTEGKDWFTALNDSEIKTTLVLANDDTVIQCAQAKEQFERYCPQFAIKCSPMGGHDFPLIYPVETMKLCEL